LYLLPGVFFDSCYTPPSNHYVIRGTARLINLKLRGEEWLPDHVVGARRKFQDGTAVECI
jgi:hypothetical protein